MSATVIRGDARHLPLADGSVDLVVTSPPYFALRSYTDGGEHYAGQVGSEPTPAEFLAALWDVTRECVRVLKPGGSIFVNLGDKYGGSGDHNIRPKSLMGLPWRYAIGCIDQLGLILRAEIVWGKLTGLPESVTDRVRRSHEQWFHLTKEPRYYAAVDEVREPHLPQSLARTERNRFAPDLSQNGVGSPNTLDPATYCNPLGALPGSVQTVASEPLTVPAHLGDHFAAFPSWWPWWIIKGWSPKGICVECGEGRRPVVKSGRNGDGSKPEKAARRVASFDWAAWQEREPTLLTGYACACSTPNAPIRPAVILDPFGGTGTTAMMADALGRHGITVDLSADYSRLADWRIFESGQGARLLAKHEGHRGAVTLPQRSHPTLFGAL